MKVIEGEINETILNAMRWREERERLFGQIHAPCPFKKLEPHTGAPLCMATRDYAPMANWRRTCEPFECPRIVEEESP